MGLDSEADRETLSSRSAVWNKVAAMADRDPEDPGTDPRVPWASPALLRWRRWTDAPFLVIAIGSLPLLLLELKVDRLIPEDRSFLFWVNLVVLAVFAVDYAAEFALASDRPAYVRSEWASLLIVVSQALALLPSLSAFGALRALRAMRGLGFLRALVMLARVVAIGGEASKGGREILRRHALGFALGVAGFTWITAAVAFTLAEDVGRHGRVASFGDALWWSLATVTTVGYGDIVPVTFVGRVVGGFTMIVGISTFALVTAKIAEFLVREESA
ncbi:MAG: potassium channel family protein, partial [Alphaproteobacteria bacterium]